MSESIDYLFDKRGTPDAEVLALESLFLPLAHDGRPLAPFALPVARPGRGRLLPFRPLGVWPYAVAALLLVGAWFALMRRDPVEAEVVLTRGEPARMVTAVDVAQHVVAKDVADFDVLPRSELRVDDFRDGELRLHLVRGEVRARIAAPLGKGATVVRLGSEPLSLEASWIAPCDFRFELRESGVGAVHVAAGEVLAVRGTRRLVVPAGASLAFDRVGLGWPLFDDCSPDVRAAAELAAVYESKVGPEILGKAAAGLVATAKTARDTLVLWNLLQLGEPAVQAGVEMRLLELVGPPTKAPTKSWSADAWLEHLRRTAWSPRK